MKRMTVPRFTIGKFLADSLKRNDGTQKGLAQDAGLSKSTTNDYINDKAVAANEAVNLANSLNDPVASMQIGNAMLGLLKAFDGDGLFQDARGIYAKDVIEEREEKDAQNRDRIFDILNDPVITDDDKQKLQEWVVEKMDSTVMDITLLVTVTKMLGTTMTEMFDQRIPYYQQRRYMKGDESGWQQQNRNPVSGY